jgi:hypothetical protein
MQMETVRHILDSESGLDFGKIESALAAEQQTREEAEAVLSVLILRRHMQGPNGLCDALVTSECTQRLEMLPDHLYKVGAYDAAARFRRIRAKLPEPEVLSPGAVYDLLDQDSELMDLVQETSAACDNLDDLIEAYLWRCPENVLEAETVARRRGPRAWLRAFFA